MNTILLAIIALSELTRLVLTHRNPSKKAHFKGKLAGVEKQIYDFEFKLAKTQMIREEIREQYDQMKSRIMTLEDQIKNWPKDKDEGDRKRLEDDKIRAEVEVKRYEGQMKNLDEQMYGAKPTNENPEGVQGITYDIDSMRELSEMLREHIRSI